MRPPLHGIRVIDLTVAAAGPFATTILAEQGADVIKVERPGSGDFMRSLGTVHNGVTGVFAGFNRGKRAIALDLKHPEGLALLHDCRPSLLLVDLQLPDVSGATIIEFCRRSPALSSMPVIVLTADASVPTRRAIEALGVTHLAVKPFDLVELRVVVESLLAYG